MCILSKPNQAASPCKFQYSSRDAWTPQSLPCGPRLPFAGNTFRAGKSTAKWVEASSPLCLLYSDSWSAPLGDQFRSGLVHTPSRSCPFPARMPSNPFCPSGATNLSHAELNSYWDAFTSSVCLPSCMRMRQFTLAAGSIGAMAADREPP